MSGRLGELFTYFEPMKLQFSDDGEIRRRLQAIKATKAKDSFDTLEMDFLLQDLVPSQSIACASHCWRLCFDFL